MNSFADWMIGNLVGSILLMASGVWLIILSFKTKRTEQFSESLATPIIQRSIPSKTCTVITEED
jgi:hypothetical protein